jgi:hypothetical protein
MPEPAWETIGAVDVGRVLTPLARLLRQLHARDVELGHAALAYVGACADQRVLLALLAAAEVRLAVLDARLARKREEVSGG